MAARAPRLKVYEAQLGFFDTAVAAPNQAAALEAWGVRQNLFAEGRAKVTTDKEVAKAAFAQPGRPVRRRVGLDGVFEARPRVERSSGRRDARARAAKPADRSRLNAAEATLARLREAHDRDLAELDVRQAALDKQRRSTETAFSRAERTAMAHVEAAQRAFRKAGGKP